MVKEKVLNTLFLEVLLKWKAIYPFLEKVKARIIWSVGDENINILADNCLPWSVCPMNMLIDGNNKWNRDVYIEALFKSSRISPSQVPARPRYPLP